MSAEVTRASLLSRVRDPSDHAAWAEFEACYRELILRYCCRCGLSATDAEDVGQMVMVRLLRVLPSFRYDPARGRFHDYLYRVTRSAISDYQASPETRSRAVLEQDTVERAAAQEDATADGDFEQEWRDNHLRLALTAVRHSSDPRSVAVFERLLAGASVEETAREFAMTPDAVHKIKQRLRARVQARIAEQMRDEEEPNQ